MDLLSKSRAYNQGEKQLKGPVSHIFPNGCNLVDKGSPMETSGDLSLRVS